MMLTPGMFHRHTRWATLCSLTCCLILGCDGKVTDSDSRNLTTQDPIAVYVVNYPLQYFAEQIGGTHVTVTFPAPAGEDPAFWIPDASTVAAYQTADVILLNGATYAKWTTTVSLPATKRVDTSASFAERYIQIKDAMTHSHGPGEHTHEGTAFTTWLDPKLAMEQARAVADALIQVAPQHKNDFQRNLAILDEAFIALDKQLQLATQDHHNTPLLFSHPVYQYLQRCCQLNGRSMHWEPGELPTEEMWKELETLLEKHPAQWMLWESQPTAETEERLRALGVKSVVYAPCGNRPAQGDFHSQMRSNVERLESALAAP